jgi:elongation factor Ts
MRKAGQAKADKKASRVAAEGLIVVRQAAGAMAMAEINCETDFVTKNDDFRAFAADVAEVVLREGPTDLDALLASVMANGQSVEQNRRDCIAKIGENINVRRGVRLASSTGVLGSYLHGTRIGVLVELDGGDADLAKDIAMHVAASRPLCVSADQVPAELIAKEKEIYAAQAVDEAKGKPANVIDKIIEKIVEGKLRKYFESATLLGQMFVKDDKQSVGDLLSSRKARVIRFERFELGEGIEKKADNFAAEVAAARGE